MTGIELIAKERQRQIEQEGYTEAHDMEHSANDLVCAAISYLSCNFPEGVPAKWWPWRKQDYKPKDYVSNIKRAAALCAAALDVFRHKLGDEQRLAMFGADDLALTEEHYRKMIHAIGLDNGKEYKLVYEAYRNGSYYNEPVKLWEELVTFGYAIARRSTGEVTYHLTPKGFRTVASKVNLLIRYTSEYEPE